MVITLLFLSGILLLAFLLRAIPRLILPYGIASDSYFHLYLVKLLLKNKLRYPKRDERFILNPLCTYPYLHHLICAFFGKKAIHFMDRFSSAIYDTINTLLVFLFTWFSKDFYNLPMQFVFLPALLYALHPILFKFGDEPRVFSGSSRVLAQTLYFAHCLGLFLYLNEYFLSGAVLALITAAMIFNVTKFGIQVIIFFGIIFSFIIPLYLPLLLSAFGLSVIMSRGRTWNVLYIHIQHLIFLTRTNLYYRKLSLRTDIKKTFHLWKGLLTALLQLHIWKAVKDFFLNLDPIHNLLLGYHTILILFLWPWMPEHGFFFCWLLGGVIFFLLTKSPRFRFIGKAERYLEFSLVPSFILCSLAMEKYNISIILVIPYLAYCMIGIFVFLNDFILKYRDENEEFSEVSRAFENFNRQNTPGLVWTLNQHFHKPIFFTDFPILGYFAGTINQSESTKKEIDDMMKNYPFPDFDVYRIIQEYNIKYIVANKERFFQYLQRAGIPEAEIQSRFEILDQTKSMIFVRPV